MSWYYDFNINNVSYFFMSRNWFKIVVIKMSNGCILIVLFKTGLKAFQLFLYLIQH
jgi:hypothetical protein